MTENIFNELDPAPVTPTTPEGNHLDSLVGEGKKFADAEALAKGKIMSDQMIEHMKAEQAELRAELEKRKNLEEFMQALDSRTPVENTPVKPQPVEIEPKENSLDMSQIEALMDKKLTTAQQSAVEAQNLQDSISAARAKWGDQAQVELNKAATELGMTMEGLQSYAKQNPSAFKRLIGIDTPVSPTSVPVTTVQGDVDTAKMTSSNSSQKTYKDFQTLRRENPSEYFSAKNQNLMMKLATEMGEDFYK